MAFTYYLVTCQLVVRSTRNGIKRNLILQVLLLYIKYLAATSFNLYNFFKFIQHNQIYTILQNEQIFLMRQAHRVYLKYKYRVQHQSPIFRSSIGRGNLIGNRNNQKEQPGPGSYEITLPLVKPKYEAIIKNNRSIIIKVNEGNAPPFCSKEARFKQQYSTLQNKDYKTLDLKQIDKKMFQKMKTNRRQKMIDFNRQKSNASISSIQSLLQKNNSCNASGTKKTKGSQWSRYRQQRRLWKQSNMQMPGPGSYQILSKRTVQAEQKNSWQFRQHIKRQMRSLNNSMKTIQEPQDEEKINAIHSRHNIKWLSN